MITVNGMATEVLRLLATGTRRDMLDLELKLLGHQFASGVSKAGPGPLSPRRQQQFAGVRAKLARVSAAVAAGQAPAADDVDFLRELAELGWAAPGIRGDVATAAKLAA